MSNFTLADLEKIVAARAGAPADESWTAKLVCRGQKKAAQKLGEEAVEAALAAVDGDRDELTAEAADLLYHLMVVLKIAEVPLSDVMAELESRTGRSGLEEKAGREKT
ncbi:phosphoribosyl-ATP diphosphatase [Hoeflea prorocentri]|uniref:Phosphoribosyl-ATP pyrophosphatase n=1 Tax=Hoeflea prorocentri TaxID=1922333 RepID=A0A9X3ZJT4_9HYPH|nr:phosphoribosyl-ATP diphosphatase [Hoeflea prorocentri]MCY6383145.1 phosphoribosyl-ATP diphosphatase [Hoeflea prorocentri]MDA5400945.1 phosphoribosyl-ATP diphosphatase [Hoeflea prorocentri]